MRHVNVRITIVALVKTVRSLNFFKPCWRISRPWTSKGFFVIVVLRTIGLVVFDVNWKWLIKEVDVIVEVVKDESVVVRMMTKKNNRCDRIESISSLFRRTMTMIHFVTGERTNERTIPKDRRRKSHSVDSDGRSIGKIIINFILWHLICFLYVFIARLETQMTFFPLPLSLSSIESTGANKTLDKKEKIRINLLLIRFVDRLKKKKIFARGISSRIEFLHLCR